MIEPLKEAFNEVAKLPEGEEMRIAELIKEELASEKHWPQLFHDPRSEYVLKNW